MSKPEPHDVELKITFESGDHISSTLKWETIETLQSLHGVSAVVEAYNMLLREHKMAEEIEKQKCPDCGSPKRDTNTPKQDPCKPDKNVKVPKYVYLTEGYDPDKLPR